MVTAPVALIDDGVLDGEDIDTLELEQATRWVRTYAELLGMAVGIQAEQPPLVDALRHQTDMYSRRLAFWKERCRAIADRYP